MNLRIEGSLSEPGWKIWFILSLFELHVAGARCVILRTCLLLM